MASLLELVGNQTQARKRHARAMGMLKEAESQLSHWETQRQIAKEWLEEVNAELAEADLAVFRAEQKSKEGGIIRLI